MQPLVGEGRRLILLFRCCECGAHLRAEAGEAGGQTRCPDCHRSLTIPNTSAEAICPSCRLRIRFSTEVAGDTFHCPECEAPVPLPGESSYAVLSGQELEQRLGAGIPPDGAPKTRRGLAEFSKRNWCIINCLTGEGCKTEAFPFEIGSAEAVDLRLNEVAPNHCALVENKKGRISLAIRDPSAHVILNGVPMQNAAQLEPAKDYSLQLGNHFFVLRGGRSVEKWIKSINLQQWIIHQPQINKTEGPMGLEALSNLVASQQYDPRATILYPSGTTMGFYMWQLGSALANLERRSSTGQESADSGASLINFAISSDKGDLLCPVCWLRFDKGDVMHVASHESLRGDPLLGEDAMLRFAATRFNNNGQALDAMGVPCPDTACPHCRRKLPPGFLDLPHRIISLIGETTAGKTYYLSVAAKVLPEVLYRHFGVTFKDADPTGNRHLNAMKNRLFSGATPEQVRLEKTQTQGDLYERVILHGQETRLPTPFMFSLASARDGAAGSGLVFYDLAGELFQPGVSEYDAPKTQHIAVASALLFLFDPSLNRGFRERLRAHTDPQLQSRQLDQQDTLLAEMEVRIRRHLHLDARARIRTPLAILVGKCDIWLPLLGDLPLSPIITDSQLDLCAVAENSRRVRALLNEICPTIVANAESLAEQVTYFAISSFGHSPVRLSDGNLAPDPQRLRPLHVEQPFMWALAKTIPDLLPIREDVMRMA